MPNTCFTPSASRHSTKTSEALRGMFRTLLMRSQMADRRSRPHLRAAPVVQLPLVIVRRALPALLLLLLLVAVPAADAATRQIIRGAGFGHGIGMSQYGAYGYARHGVGY